MHTKHAMLQLIQDLCTSSLHRYFLLLPLPRAPFFAGAFQKKKSYMILSSFPTTIYIFSDDYTERQREKEENNLILCCDNTSDLLAQVRTVTGFVLTYMFVVFHVRARARVCVCV